MYNTYNQFFPFLTEVFLINVVDALSFSSASIAAINIFYQNFLLE